MWSKLKKTKKEVYKLWNTKKPNGKRMYDQKEIASMLGIHRATVRRWLSQIGVPKMEYKIMSLTSHKPMC